MESTIQEQKTGQTFKLSFIKLSSRIDRFRTVSLFVPFEAETFDFPLRQKRLRNWGSSREQSDAAECDRLDLALMLQPLG